MKAYIKIPDGYGRLPRNAKWKRGDRVLYHRTDFCVYTDCITWQLVDKEWEGDIVDGEIGIRKGYKVNNCRE
jgi:hypothetical protein